MLPLRYGALWLTIGWLMVLGLIFGSLLPSIPVAPRLVGDKIAHFVAYLVLMTWFAGIYRGSRYGVIVVALLALGIGLELMQGILIPRRSADWLDVLANLGGIGAGLVLALIGLGGWCARLERRLVSARE